MELLCPLLIVGLILVAILTAVVAYGKRADAAWEEVGKKRGLRYHREGLSKRRLTGKIEGFPVRVECFRKSRGKHSSTHTVYTLRYPHQGLGFTLKRAGALLGVARFLGVRDVRVGDPEFDAEVLVKGERAREIREYLTKARRDRIRRLFSLYRGAVVRDGEIEWSQHRLATSAEQMATVLDRFVRLARFLSTEVPESPVESPDIPLLPLAAVPLVVGGVAAAPPEPPPLPEPEPEIPMEPLPEPDVSFPTEEEIEADAGLESEEEIAPQEMLEPEAVLPPEEEIEPTVESDAAIESEVEPEPEIEPEREEEPASALGSAVEVERICEDLFAGGRMGSEVNRIFEERYRDHPVRWSGTLERIDDFYSDRIFGSQPGSKAILLIHELTDATMGALSIRAVLRLTRESADPLRSRTAEPFSFEGRLVHCDPYMRQLFVEGTLQPSP